MKKILILFLFSLLLSKNEYIAVLDLEPSGLTATESRVLSQALTSEIINLGTYIVVERNNIDKILEEQKFQHSGCTDQQCAVEIGQLLNADYTIIGNAGKLGSTYTINARIIKVETGEAIQSAQYTHKGEIDELLSAGVTSIAHELLNLPYQQRNNVSSVIPKFDELLFSIYYNEDETVPAKSARLDVEIITSKFLGKVINTKIDTNIRNIYQKDNEIFYTDVNGHVQNVNCHFISKIINTSTEKSLAVDCNTINTNTYLEFIDAGTTTKQVRRMIQNARKLDIQDLQLIYTDIEGYSQYLDCYKILHLISNNDMYIADCKKGIFIKSAN